MHPTQYSARGGTLQACVRINYYAECVARRAKPIFAVSIDYEKLFNTISPEIALEVMVAMGLDRQAAASIANPILASRGTWRLPFLGSCPI